MFPETPMAQNIGLLLKWNKMPDKRLNEIGAFWRRMKITDRLAEKVNKKTQLCNLLF